MAGKQKHTGSDRGARGGRVPRVVDARFVASADRPDGFETGPPEFAFIGRSNVGKSSLLNALCQRHALARTSKTPGRTRRVNVFDLRLADGTELRFADLPGYGHAKVAASVRSTFGPMIEGWIRGRATQRAVCLLIDVRREAEPEIIDFLGWLAQEEITALLIATKLDKEPRTKRFSLLSRLGQAYGQPGPLLGVSAHDGEGLDVLWQSLLALARTDPA